jgi:hypothetical protein
MYIPSHQYEVKALVDTEQRLQYENGTPFTGSKYVELTNGTKYDVPNSDLEKGNFDRGRKLLTPINFRDPRLALSFLTPFIPKRKPGKTTIKRKFVKHKVTGKIIEVDENKYQEVFTEEPSHLAFGELTLHIAGPLYDISSLNILQEGTITKNAREVQVLERSLPGVSSYLGDLTFLSDPQYVDQTPQIPLNTTIILPSPS